MACSTAAAVACGHSRVSPGPRGRPIDHGRRAARIVRAAGNEDLNAPPFVVPQDCFQDKTYPPALKAAKQLKLLVTMVAVRVVLAQEEGFGNECHDDPSYTELHDDLTTFLSQNPLGKLWDGEWLEKLIRHPKLNCRLAAVRIIEVRDVYLSKEFDWGLYKSEAFDDMDECYKRLMSEHMERSMLS